MADNRRVRYTKNSLKESLITLLKHKPLSRITVKELCEEAEINRTTFYRYYADPYDLLSQLSDEFLDGVANLLTVTSADEWSERDFRTIEKYCQYYYDNRELYLVLINTGNVEVQDEALRRHTQEKLFESWEKKNIHLDEDDRQYALAYLTAGSNSIIRKWLSEDSDKYSPREIARFIHNGNFGGLRKMSFGVG